MTKSLWKQLLSPHCNNDNYASVKSEIQPTTPLVKFPWVALKDHTNVDRTLKAAKCDLIAYLAGFVFKFRFDDSQQSADWFREIMIHSSLHFQILKQKLDYFISLPNNVTACVRNHSKLKGHDANTCLPP